MAGATDDPSRTTRSVDGFHALARRSPWRWRTLHFRYRDESEQPEARVRRPGRLVVRTADGRLCREERAVLAHVRHGGRRWRGAPSVDDGHEPVTPDRIAPLLRPDGLVGGRPDLGFDAQNLEVDGDVEALVG